MNGRLGFIPLITAGISAALQFYGAKKAEKKERDAFYQANAQAISSGQAVTATSLMSETAKENLRRVWPYIRETAPFTSINWAKLGLPNGPGLSAAATVGITGVWDNVRQAARFDDVNWNYAAVPVEAVAAALPVPELPQYMQPYAPPAKYVDARPGLPIQTAGLTGDIPPAYVAAGIGAALLLIALQRR